MDVLLWGFGMNVYSFFIVSQMGTPAHGGSRRKTGKRRELGGADGFTAEFRIPLENLQGFCVSWIYTV